MAPKWYLVLKLSVFPKMKLTQDKNERIRRYLRALLYLFNINSLFLATLACTSVYACDRLKFSYNMDITLVSTGITFPLIFNIGQAFTRRERALSLIANLKASAVSLYFMHRDWAQDESFPASLGNDHSAAALHCKLLLMDLLKDVRKYLIANSPFESYAEQRLAGKHNPYVNMILADMSLSGASQLSFQAAVDANQKQDPAAAALRRCYRGFSRLSVLNERLGLRSGYTKGGEGGMSRTNQYLRYMIQNLEELRMIREYRTPIMMRYANGVLIHIFSMALAPYFVHFCDSWQSLGYSRNSCPAGYSAAIVFTIICMLLYNVQQDIEQPFDMDGLDDVFFDIGDDVLDDVMSPTAGATAAPSGFSTPKQGIDTYGSNGMCPCSPSFKCQVPDLSQHGPWSLAATGSHLAANTVKLTPQATMLHPVSEEDSTGFANIGFATAAANAVGMQRANSKELLVSKQHQQHLQHDKYSARGADNRSTASPARGVSPSGSIIGAAVAGANREAAALKSCSSSCTSIDRMAMGVDHHDSVHAAAVAAAVSRLGQYASPNRDAAASPAATVELSKSFTLSLPSGSAGPHAGRNSRYSLDKVDAIDSLQGEDESCYKSISGAAERQGEPRSSTDSNAESSRLIKTAAYSSTDW